MPQSPRDQLDFPCSYTFRAYSAELDGEDLPSLTSRPQPLLDFMPFDSEDLKDAIRQVLAEKHFKQVVTRARAQLLQESKAAARPPVKEKSRRERPPLAERRRGT